MYLCHFALNTSLVSHHLPRLRHICRAPPLSPLRCRCFYSDYTSFNLSCDNLWHHWHIPTLFVLGAPCYSVTFYYYYSGNSVLLCDTLQARFLCNSLFDSVVLWGTLYFYENVTLCFVWLCGILFYSVLLWYSDTLITLCILHDLTHSSRLCGCTEQHSTHRQSQPGGHKFLFFPLADGF